MTQHRDANARQEVDVLAALGVVQTRAVAAHDLPSWLERLRSELDDNEQAQKRLQREQDGSEVKSVQLETLIGVGQSLIERRDSLELFRETAADIYLRTLGTPWSQRSGSRVNHRQMTAAMIDSRDFIAAKRRADNEVLLPAGTKIAFSGGETTDHRLIWDKLDQVHAKHPDMVLLHGGSPKGAERIAATWAHNRKVPQVAFKPDWAKHAKAAPFKRNDQMLAGKSGGRWERTYRRGAGRTRDQQRTLPHRCIACRTTPCPADER